MAHELTARLLSQPGAEISYTFFGTPWVSVDGPIANFSVALDQLAYRIYDFYFSREKDTGMEYVCAGYLASKVHDLYLLADDQAQRANCITRVFIAIRRFCLSFLTTFEIWYTRELFGLSYLGEIGYEIPSRLISENPFLAQNLPLRPNENYAPRQLVEVFERFLAQEAH